ncbi:hypothetical protein [Flavobacterium piscis]|uniref:Lipoprotein n=1 Tax=Flavobacterium piscis TaxID=1114874 RepID=A0ABU1YC89_9FLAO|nr:hypothetical protein [Flavobacterium piscis]MDR7211867.1 hypothetical protein [Flavobacterium piscis]
MDGLSKKTVFFFLFLAFMGCKKDEKVEINKNNLIEDGRNLIIQNSNVLIDSLERYDLRFLNEKEKLEPFTVGVLDSIIIDERYSKYSETPHKFFTFKLKKSDFLNFKSLYQLKLINKGGNESNVVLISFSNLKIENDKAEIMVTKINGISSVIDRYYFKKQNSKWIFVRKKQVSMG